MRIKLVNPVLFKHARNSSIKKRFSLTNAAAQFSLSRKANTTGFKIGDEIFVNGVAGVVASISGGSMILQDGTVIQNAATDNRLSKVENSTGLSLGDTVYINGIEEKVLAIAGAGFTTEGGTTIENIASDLRFSIEPNTTGLSIGDKVYINGTEETVASISGVSFTTEEGTSILNVETDPTFSKDPNVTGLSIGDEVYINGVKQIVASISGSSFTTQTGQTVQDTENAPSFSTEPNTTGLSIGTQVYINGIKETVQSISGKGFTTKEGTVVEDITTDKTFSSEPNSTGLEIDQIVWVQGKRYQVDTVSGSSLTLIPLDGVGDSIETSDVNSIQGLETSQPFPEWDKSIEIVQNIEENQNSVTYDLNFSTSNSQPVTYSIVSDYEDGAFFSINESTGKLTLTQGNFDYETKSFYKLKLAVSNVYGSGEYKTLTLNIKDAVEVPPSWPEPEETIFVLENTPTSIKLNYSNNPNPGDDLNGVTYSLSGEDFDKFTINEAGDIFFVDSPDRETQSSYSIRVVIENGFETSDPIFKTLNVNINNVVEIAPTWNNTQVSVNIIEGQVAVPYVASDYTDGDDGSGVSYELDTDLITSPDYEQFNLNSTTGALNFNNAPDYESGTREYNVGIYVKNSIGRSLLKLLINVQNINDSTGSVKFIFADNGDPKSGLGTPIATEAIYTEGDEITIVANENDGFDFVKWSFAEIVGVPDLPLSLIIDPESSLTTFTMPGQDVYLTPHYEESTIKITTHSSSPESNLTTIPDPLDVNGKVLSFKYGDEVTIESKQPTGWGFNYWEFIIPDDPTGAPNNIEYVDGFTRESNPTKFKVPDQDFNIISSESTIDYTVTINDEEINSLPDELENGNKYKTVNFTEGSVTISVSEGATDLWDEDKDSFFNYGSWVNITASPNLGYDFDTSWSQFGDSKLGFAFNSNDLTYGGVLPPQPSSDGLGLSFFMPAKNISVQANFHKVEYKVDVQGDNGSPSAAGNFNIGETITLAPNPKPGYIFESWTTDPHDLAITDNTFVMPPEDVFINANYTLVTYDVTVSGEFGNPSASGVYSAGQTITLSANPNEGYELSSWTVVSGGVAIDTTDNTFTMGGEDVSITANYAPINYKINFIAENGSPSASGAPNIGETITLTPNPNVGFEFSGWTTETEGVTINEDNTFTMIAGNVSITANYTAQLYTLNINSTEGGTVTEESGSGAYYAGQEVKLTYNNEWPEDDAYSRYELKTWEFLDDSDSESSEGSGETSTQEYSVPANTKFIPDPELNNLEKTLTFTMPAQDVTVRANFEKWYPVSIIHTSEETYPLIWKISGNYHIDENIFERKTIDGRLGHTVFVPKGATISISDVTGNMMYGGYSLPKSFVIPDYWKYYYESKHVHGTSRTYSVKRPISSTIEPTPTYQTTQDQQEVALPDDNFHYIWKPGELSAGTYMYWLDGPWNFVPFTRAIRDRNPGSVNLTWQAFPPGGAGKIRHVTINAEDTVLSKGIDIMLDLEQTRPKILRKNDLLGKKVGFSKMDNWWESQDSFTKSFHIVNDLPQHADYGMFTKPDSLSDNGYIVKHSDGNVRFNVYDFAWIYSTKSVDGSDNPITLGIENNFDDGSASIDSEGAVSYSHDLPDSFFPQELTIKATNKYGSALLKFNITENINQPYWTQVGERVFGPPEHTFFGKAEYSEGVAISDDGTVVAVPQIYYNDNAGIVRVYKYQEEQGWTQIGNAIEGSARYDRYGTSISLSADGSILAFSAPRTKKALIYKNLENDWVQIGEIYLQEGLGPSVSLTPDGNTIVITNSYDQLVSVFKNTSPGTGDEWVQIGNTISIGEAVNNKKTAISSSISHDGTIIAIGSSEYSYFSPPPGYVEVYKYNSASSVWEMMGDRLSAGNDADSFGASVSLNQDGTLLAVGVPFDQSRKGAARVYQYTSGSWGQVGLDIQGAAKDEACGTVVSISADGLTLSVSSKNSHNRLGSVQVFKNKSGTWTQHGRTMVGPGGGFGEAMALSRDGKYVAVTAPSLSNTTKYSGAFIVYRWDY